MRRVSVQLCTSYIVFVGLNKSNVYIQKYCSKGFDGADSAAPF